MEEDSMIPFKKDDIRWSMMECTEMLNQKQLTALLKCINGDRGSIIPHDKQSDKQADEPEDLEDVLFREEELEKYKQNREEIEIAKVRRKVSLWLQRPKQTCSIILKCYMILSENGKTPVKVNVLKAICENAGVEKFNENYNQMKNFGIRNHAKLFQEKDGYVSLWLPVSAFVKEQYHF